jgi:hypothetical protein
MRLFLLSIILLIMLCTPCLSAGWTITITLSAYPPEVVPVGYGIDCATYDSPELDIWISSGPPIDKDWPTDSPKLSITVIPHDIPSNVKVTSISVSAFIITEFLLTDTLTKTFEVNYNETAYVSTSPVPAFSSSFSTDYRNSLGL